VSARLADRLRGERGFTVVEVLVAATMMVGVSGAALTALSEFGTTTRLNTIQTDAQQEARRALGELSRELRNLASPTNELPQAIEKAAAGDLVFLSVGDAKPAGSSNAFNTKRVRYCLDTAGAVLWRQQQTWTTSSAPALPATTQCPAPPATGWSEATQAAQNVRNGARPVFTYNSANLSEITEIRAKLYVDADPNARPLETEIETGVFLRNQNRGPASSFTAAVSGPQVLLNGSASTDPEGKALSFEWLDGEAVVGQGIVLTYTPSAPGAHTLKLKVRDPAGLESTSAPQTVCIVSESTPCP
jgi:type II secretory pathway pseudopilin PulG